MSPEPILEVRGLERRFVVRRSLFGGARGVISAVADVDLTVPRGTTVALVGESGSGKTTLARCIARLDRPDRGTVRFAGCDVLRARGEELLRFRRELQTVFQDPYSSLNPRRTVGEAIADGPAIHNLLTRHERVELVADLLVRVGLRAQDARRYPHEFSGGQRQRIAIARALALSPLFVIADEAVSALDVSVRAQILNLLRDLQRERGLTYLFISHDLSVVRHIADRIVLMRSGRIVEEGETDEVFCNPKHPYTQALLRAVPRPDPSRRTRSARSPFLASP
jgi:ABC-type oligopeptide transport system ATPase subunit